MSASTIAAGVADMHAAMAAQPPNAAMAAFAREQAELAGRAGYPAGGDQPADPGWVAVDAAEKRAGLHGALRSGNTIARGLRIVTQPSEEARAAQLQLGLDLTTVNADGTTGVPMPTVLVLDAEHVIRWIDVHLNYGTRTEPHQILHAIDQLSL